MPIWIEEEDRVPYRPSMAICARLPSGLVFTSELQEGRVEPSGVWEVLAGAIEAWSLVPGLVQVSEAELADDLRERLADCDLPVELCNELSVLEKALGALAHELVEPTPGPLDGEGVTVEQMASFAEAAARFVEAAPWRHLAGDDPVCIESPEVPPEVRYLTVMGHAGQQYGLLFQRDPSFFQERDAEKLEERALEEGVWSISFDPANRIPPEDHDLWELHRLPLAHDRAFPVAAHIGGSDGIRRPDARLLDLFEGLLRLLASTTEDEMDQGRWSREVVTHLGRTTFVLSLPMLLDPPRLETQIPILAEREMERVLREIDRRMESETPASIDEVNALVRQVIEEGEARRSSLGPEEEAQELVSEAAGLAYPVRDGVPVMLIEEARRIGQ